MFTPNRSRKRAYRQVVITDWDIYSLDGASMTQCEECLKKGHLSSTRRTYPCALCGQYRCDIHSVWVPAYFLQRPAKSTEAVLKILRGQPEEGWYSFCGRPSHIPRGVPIWYGKERKGGKIVEAIPNYEKKEGFEEFEMWEVGIVEDGFEGRWEKAHYELSCELAPVMSLALQLHRKQSNDESFIDSLHSMVFQTLAAKKSTLFSASKKDLMIGLGRPPSLSELFGFICSRCGVVACVNRLKPFYDKKTFGNLIAKPESVIPM
ncbi:MAG: hypothetical protein EAX95_04870 [Candidatus Thorarchaeota archaeon]|nr:hypothetical protein [Candidatus Thorarchaeota archaeon]